MNLLPILTLKPSSMDQEQIAQEIEVQDWVLNYGQVLFIKHWDYQAYCRNPISNSDWLAIKPEIKDKEFLRNLSTYKECPTLLEKIYKVYKSL